MVGAMVEFVEYSIAIEDPEAIEQSTEDIMKMMGALGKLILPSLLIWIGGWIVWAMIEGEFFRRVLRDEANGGFPWRFGRDEMWVMVSQIVLGLVYYALYTAFYLLAIAVMMPGIVSSGSPGGGTIVAVSLISIIGIFCSAFVLIRLAPASAMSVAKKDFAIGQAWQVTKGRYWPTFGAYAFHYIIGTIVYYIFMIAVIVAVMANIGIHFDGVGSTGTDADTVAQIKEALSLPQVLVSTALGSFVFWAGTGLWLMFIAGISAHVTNLHLSENDNKSLNVFD